MNNKSSSAKKLQQGAALIAVLVVLLIVTVLGVTAMRMGLSGLVLANNSQVSQLLFQSADMGTVQIRKTIEMDVKGALQLTGVVGNPTGGDTHLCFRPRDNGTDFKHFKTGACDPNDTASYLSQRAIVLTQVSYNRNVITDGDSSNDVDDISREGSSTSATGASERLRTFSTSVVPSFGSASQTTIKECLQQPADDEDVQNSSVYTITDCLTKVGAVFTTHVTEYRIIK
ncbi:MAG TPA: hypothetical protein PKN43_03670 [Agitococcus sp.]|nr:hypothetical protein [Agitococcus sp.]